VDIGGQQHVSGQPLVSGSAVYVTGLERGVGTANFVVRALGRGSGAQLWQRAFSVDRLHR
jgi:hypothetical protein